MRTLAAAVLTFQSLVIALAIPVAISVYGVSGAAAGWIGGSLAIACLLVASLLRFPWAYGLGWAIQVLSILAGFVVPAMFVLGGIFAALWWAALHYGRKGDEAQARFRALEAQGLTPDDVSTDDPTAGDVESGPSTDEPTPGA